MKFESINEILNNTEKCVKDAMCDICYVRVPEEVKKQMKECGKTVKHLQNTLPKIENVFMRNKKYKNGFIKKCVINVLNNGKYKRSLKEFVAEVRKNKTKNFKGLSNYIDYHDLSVNSKEVSKTLKAIEEYLVVLEYAINNNDILGIPELLLNLNILINRIRKLYELYKIYLEDIGKAEEYNSISNVLEDINNVIEHFICECGDYQEWLEENRL